MNNFILDLNQKEGLDFTHKPKNSIIWNSGHTSRGYSFYIWTKSKNNIAERTQFVNRENITVFKDSLIKEGYKVGLEIKTTKKPDFSIQIEKFAFKKLSPYKDSIHEFSLKVILNPNSKKPTIILSNKYQTFTSKSILTKRLAEKDIYVCSINYVATNINRLDFNLELISKNPPIYLDNNSMLDCNYSASIYY